MKAYLIYIQYSWKIHSDILVWNGFELLYIELRSPFLMGKKNEIITEIINHHNENHKIQIQSLVFCILSSSNI